MTRLHKHALDQELNRRTGPLMTCIEVDRFDGLLQEIEVGT